MLYLCVTGVALGDGVTGGMLILGDGVTGIGFPHSQLQNDNAAQPLSLVARRQMVCAAPPAFALHKQFVLGAGVIGLSVVGGLVASQLHTQGPIVAKFSQSSCVSLKLQKLSLLGSGDPQ